MIKSIVARSALDLFACHENQNKGCWYDIIRTTLILTISKYFTDDHIQVVGSTRTPQRLTKRVKPYVIGKVNNFRH